MPPSAACSLSCASSCSQGQTSCVSGGVATCTLASNGCWAYGTPTACTDPHQTCTGSSGSAECTCSVDPYCTSTASVCTNTMMYATCTRDTQGCYYAEAMTACGNTMSCKTGTCLLDDGERCTIAAECASNACTGFYVDADGDGYGAESAAVGFCGTAPPPGYATSHDDCCDVVTDGFNLHPNQTMWFTSPSAASCGTTWDYNCDNIIEEEVTTTECTPNPAGVCPVGPAWSGTSTVPSCGTTGEEGACIQPGAAPSSFCAGTQPAPFTQGCH